VARENGFRISYPSIYGGNTVVSNGRVHDAVIDLLGARAG
jgi:hypothetical protein